MARITSKGIELKCRRWQEGLPYPHFEGGFGKLRNGKPELNQKGQPPLSPESNSDREVTDEEDV
jgi:hypothetical protein